MAGKNSKWLGPKRRKELFGDETRGTPRPSTKPQTEPAGFWRGAKIK